MCQAVMDYIIVVLGKYLQMMVAYNIFKEDSVEVSAQFEQFNMHYENLAAVFEDVTNDVYKPGVQISCEKPVAKVLPVPRDSKIARNVVNPEFNAFLEKYNLTDLEEMLEENGVTLDDVLEMDREEIKLLGIKAYRQRKLLFEAIQDHLQQGN